MSFLPDLSAWAGNGLGEHARAVGWLDPVHEFSTGTVSIGFFERLVALLKSPWQPAAAAGRHRCAFCKFTGGPSSISYAGDTIVLGSSVLVVPSANALFVAPSMIAHYVDAHGYSPPQAFMEAVLNCPEMRSIPYLRLLRAHGVSAKPTWTGLPDNASR